MKFLRIILFPVVPIYFVVTWLRNWLYNNDIKKHKSYDLPLICVGNLSTGGTGKSPMIEYLIRLLKDEKSVATLSRGYKRITEGFVLADTDATADTIGDEPFQFFKKFEGIKVAVDSNRQNGIEELLKLEDEPEVILLDDAYQHRKVKAGFNILLTSYHNLFYKDMVLPTGNLREPKSGANRANAIVVTKCPKDISEEEKKIIKLKIKAKSHQDIYFSYINYSDVVISKTNKMSVASLPKFTLVTGIAYAQPLVNFLDEKGLEFEHLEYPDHYSFRQNDIEKLSKLDLIVTTEKDYVRLCDYELLQDKLYYLPIRVNVLDSHAFDKLLKDFVN